MEFNFAKKLAKIKHQKTLMASMRATISLCYLLKNMAAFSGYLLPANLRKVC